MAMHDYLEALLGSKANIRVLKTLVRYRGKVFTIRELARASALSHPEVSRVVKRLEARGAVKLQPVGRAYQVMLNEESYSLKSIVEPVIEAEAKTLEALVSSIEPLFRHEGIVSVAFFGSVAQRRETLSSDVDLLVIAQDRELALDLAGAAGEVARARFGVGLSPLVMSASSFVRRRGESLERSILQSYTMVWGNDLKELAANVEASR